MQISIYFCQLIVWAKKNKQQIQATKITWITNNNRQLHAQNKVITTEQQEQCTSGLDVSFPRCLADQLASTRPRNAYLVRKKKSFWGRVIRLSLGSEVLLKSLGTQWEWFIRILTWGNTLFFKKRFHGGREIRTHVQRPMVCRRRHLWMH